MMSPPISDRHEWRDEPWDCMKDPVTMIQVPGIRPCRAANPLICNASRKNGTVYNFRASDGMLTSIVDLNGNTLSLTYSGSTLTTITDAASRTLSLGYTGTLLTSITACQSRVWTLGYDSSSRVNSISDPLLSGTTYSRSLSYTSSNNNVASLENRVGKTWQYAYGSGSLLTNVLTGTTDPDSHTTSSSYGAVRVTEVALPGNTGWPSETSVACPWTDLDGHTLQHGLDSSGHRVATVDSAGDQANWTYDSNHNRTAYQDQAGNIWQYEFDTQGNEKQVTDPYSKILTRTFGSYGLIATQTDALSNETQWFYNATGNLTQITDANAGNTVYVPNTDGSVSQVTDPAGHVVQYGYDTWGHQSSITVVESGTTSYITSFVYDAGSHLTQRTDALSRVTNYTLDAWGRTTTLSYPTTGDTSIQLTLDAESRWTESIDSTGTRTYGYDSWSRCNAMTDPMGNTTATYSPAGFLQNQTDVTGRTITYTPNALDELTNVSDDGGTTNAVLTYDAVERVLTATYQNGTKVTYGYDNAGRTSSIAHTVVSTGATLVSYAATYYANNWLETITEQPSGDVTTFDYDGLGNLLSEVRTGTKPYSGTYTYYADNQRKTAVVITNGVTTHNGTYTYNGAGWLIQCVDTSTTPTTTEVYTWNNDGTLASAPGSGYTKLFFYNEESQLVTIEHNTGGTITTAYQYDYGADGGRRWRKDIANNIWTWYPCGASCSAGALVEQTSNLTGETWTTSALYLRTGGSCDSTLIRRVSSTDSEYHHADPRGNFGVITSSTATVLSNNLYDYFGVQQYASGSSLTPWHQAMTYSDVDALADVRDAVFIQGRSLALLQQILPKITSCKQLSAIFGWPWVDCQVGRKPSKAPCQGKDLCGGNKNIVACCCKVFGSPPRNIYAICKSGVAVPVPAVS
jgi:YD repeat-containing protein